MTVFENDYLRKFLLREPRADLRLDVACAVEPDSIVFTSTQISSCRSSVDRRVWILGGEE
jgi:hypothetical protein